MFYGYQSSVIHSFMYSHLDILRFIWISMHWLAMGSRSQGIKNKGTQITRDRYLYAKWNLKQQITLFYLSSSDPQSVLIRWTLFSLFYKIWITKVPKAVYYLLRFKRWGLCLAINFKRKVNMIRRAWFSFPPSAVDGKFGHSKRLEDVLSLLVWKICSLKLFCFDAGWI